MRRCNLRKRCSLWLSTNDLHTTSLIGIDKHVSEIGLNGGVKVNFRLL